MSTNVPGLGSLQSEVMNLIWKKKETTVAQLVDAIGRRRPIRYTTVLSAVQKLEKKNWVTHRTEGRANVYRARRDRDEVGGRSLRDLLRTVFSGDVRLLLSSLLDDVELSDAQLRELRQLIEQRRKELQDG